LYARVIARPAHSLPGPVSGRWTRRGFAAVSGNPTSGAAARIRTAPATFTLHARNPDRDVQMGGDWVAFGRMTAVLDLDYAEDSEADTDANFVMTGSGSIVEIQATAEKIPFSEEQFAALLALARKGIAKLVSLQKLAVA